MLNIAICDDDKNLCERMTGYLDSFFEGRELEYHISSYYDSSTFLAAYQNNRFDLVFLDIAMTPMSGIEVATSIRKQNDQTSIVFVTGHSQHMQESFPLHILDYILKPVDPDRVEQLMRYYCENLCSLTSKVLVFKSGGAVYKVPLREILYFTKSFNKLMIVTAQTTYGTYTYTLDTVKPCLDASFVQTHKSFIVNMQYIVKKECKQCTLYNGEIVDCSKKYRDAFSDVYVEYLRKLG